MSRRLYRILPLALLAACLAPAPLRADKVEAVERGALDFRRGFADIAARATPAVVFVQVESTVRTQGGQFFFNDPFGGMDDEFFQRFFGGRLRRPQPQEFKRSGQGSGFIISKDGYILTNHHVVGGADRIRVKLRDGREFDAKVVGSDERSEVAVIKVEADDLPVLPLGDADKLQVGEWVVAIGNPFGLSETLTVGVVSAKGRNGMRIADYEDFIQTDAAINPGNSGGPLLNVDGEVVGINTAIYSRSGGNMGIGFAVPINMAVGIKDQLIKDGRVERGYLGVMLNQTDIDEELAKSFGLPKAGGALVADVVEKSPAATAGLKAGDVVTELDGNPVLNNAALRNTVAMIKPGTKVTLTVYRDGKAQRKTVTVGKLDEEATVGGEGQEGDEGGAERGELNEILMRKWGFAVAPVTDEDAASLGLDKARGLRVTEVRADGPAARRGITENCLVLAVNKQDVDSLAALRKLVGEKGVDGILLRVRHPQGATAFVVLRADKDTK